MAAEAKPASTSKLSWQLRIVADDELNAYASPDGTVYVESALADLAGSSSGLWAAILSHEIAHVVRRDWARRYLFQKQLEGAGASIVLVLRTDTNPEETAHLVQLSSSEDNESEVRQLTGCTSPRTMVAFPAVDLTAKPNTRWTDVYVIDAWGSVLARADLPKLPR